MALDVAEQHICPWLQRGCQHAAGARLDVFDLSQGLKLRLVHAVLLGVEGNVLISRLQPHQDHFVLIGRIGVLDHECDFACFHGSWLERKRHGVFGFSIFRDTNSGRSEGGTCRKCERQSEEDAVAGSEMRRYK